MGCQGIHDKMYDASCTSIVVMKHIEEGGCQVMGGCTFKIHKEAGFIELLYLGVRQNY
jgi:hypothetical protein